MSHSHAGGSQVTTTLSRATGIPAHWTKAKPEWTQRGRLCHLPSVQERGAPGQRMCCPPDPTRTHHQSGKLEALGVTGQTPKGAIEAKSQEPTALSVPGQTLQGNITKANPPLPDSTVVYSVNPTASYSIRGHIQGMPATFLIDTGSVISIVKSAVWTQADSLCQQLTPYTGSRLVGVEGTPLLVRGKTTADVSLISKCQ